MRPALGGKDGSVAGVGSELLKEVVGHGQAAGLAGFVVHADEQVAGLAAARHVVGKGTARLAEFIGVGGGTGSLDPKRFEVGH